MVGSPGLRAEAELPLFLGLGPLQRGVLQQLMHTEFSFPGEQKDWYPAEAMRQAADDAQDLRYMIPATQTQRSRVNVHWQKRYLSLCPNPNGRLFLTPPPAQRLGEAREVLRIVSLILKTHKIDGERDRHYFISFNQTVPKAI